MTCCETEVRCAGMQVVCSLGSVVVVKENGGVSEARQQGEIGYSLVLMQKEN